MFDRMGQITFPASVGGEDAVMEAAIEAGAEDVESDEDSHTIWTAFESLNDVIESLRAGLGEPSTTAIVWRPKTLTPVEGEAAAGLMKLIDALDEDDDVQSVYANFDISDEEMAKLG
jgi:transcriptional/translational regulatory protein YebC/TACO1